MSKAPDPIKGRCSRCGVTIWVGADANPERYLCPTCYRKNQDEINRTGREQKQAYYPGLKKGW